MFRGGAIRTGSVRTGSAGEDLLVKPKMYPSIRDNKIHPSYGGIRYHVDVVALATRAISALREVRHIFKICTH